MQPTNEFINKSVKIWLIIEHTSLRVTHTSLSNFLGLEHMLTKNNQSTGVDNPPSLWSFCLIIPVFHWRRRSLLALLEQSDIFRVQWTFSTHFLCLSTLCMYVYFQFGFALYLREMESFSVILSWDWYKINLFSFFFQTWSTSLSWFFFFFDKLTFGKVYEIHAK